MSSKRGGCQKALCNRCNVRGGRREGGAGVGRPLQIDTLHTRTACQTDRVPSSTLNQMLPRDSCSAAQRQSCEAERQRDVYIATGVPCVSNYRSALPPPPRWGLYLNSAVRRRRPCWLCLYLLLIESRSPRYYQVQLTAAYKLDCGIFTLVYSLLLRVRAQGILEKNRIWEMEMYFGTRVERK